MGAECVRREISAVVFDLDGTLVDSRRDIAEATNFVLVRSGRNALSEREISGYVGDGARSLLARAARLDVRAGELDRLLAIFLDYYTAHATDHTRPLPGAVEALETLAKELPLALCTNKPRRTTDVVLRELSLAAYFRVVVAGDDLARKKPDPLPLSFIATELGVAPSALMMVGDGAQDVECGHAVGGFSVGVRGGIQEPSRLMAARPDAMIDQMADLPELVRGLRAAQATSK